MRLQTRASGRAERNEEGGPRAPGGGCGFSVEGGRAESRHSSRDTPAPAEAGPRRDAPFTPHGVSRVLRVPATASHRQQKTNGRSLIPTSFHN